MPVVLLPCPTRRPASGWGEGRPARGSVRYEWYRRRRDARPVRAGELLLLTLGGNAGVAVGLPVMPSRRDVLATGAWAAAGVMVPAHAIPRLAASAAVAVIPPGVRYALPSGRAYYLTRPPPGGGSCPLMVGLPGTYQTATSFASASQLPTLAASRRCAVALVGPYAGRWNAGGGWPSSGQDDLAYLADVISDAATRAALTPDQVYVAGFSGGGMMVWRAMAETDLFAAAGVVSGALLVPCGRPVDVLHIHGTADTTVPLYGGAGFEGFYFPPAYAEGWRVPRASVWSLMPHTGGHAWPAWATHAVYDFCARDRLATAPPRRPSSGPSGRSSSPRRGGGS